MATWLQRTRSPPPCGEGLSSRIAISPCTSPRSAASSTRAARKAAASRPSSGRGYRFVAEVVQLDAEGAAGAPVTGGTTPLPIGDAQRPVPTASGLFRSRGLPAPAIIRPSTALIPDQGWPDTTGAPPLSIVVLPFADFSDDPNRQHFVDRITDDLTTGLSRFTSMVVTSRATASTYQNKRIDAKQIGFELGVRICGQSSSTAIPRIRLPSKTRSASGPRSGSIMRWSLGKGRGRPSIPMRSSTSCGGGPLNYRLIVTITLR